MINIFKARNMTVLGVVLSFFLSPFLFLVAVHVLGKIQ